MKMNENMRKKLERMAKRTDERVYCAEIWRERIWRGGVLCVR